ncbi:hypothetical protein TSMEX_010906 [Taenia solium]|eukprot:TsM_000924500 transcript=TsM_000924500 gene=TsM_000924500
MAVTEDCAKQTKTWSTPTNLTELLSRPRLANYYRRFVEDFAKTVDLLHKLAEKQAKENFRCANERDEVFRGLKRTTCSVLILALPNFEVGVPQFALDIDASDVAL